MVRSMTGFGRSQISTPLGEVHIEMTSVNRKALDIVTYMPKELAQFEVDLRRVISQHLARGQITLRVHRNGVDALPDVRALQRLKEHFEAVAKQMGMTDPITLPFLVNELGRWTETPILDDEEKMRTCLEEGVKTALQALQMAKQKEGEHLKEYLQKKLTEMERRVETLEKEAQQMPGQFRQRLEERLKELAMESSEVIAREVAIYADKSDVSEEITRLQSHVKKMEDVLQGDKEMGRMCDFIVQEMLREANTIGSKAINLAVKDHVLTLKGITEQIREQVQNIE